MKQPKYLFIVTNPFSGSTALAMILNNSPRSMVLTEKAEGQWLIASLCDDDRWNPDKAVDWDLVARTWYQRYQAVNQLVGTIDVIIEKSPPNMVRLEKLLDIFPNSQCPRLFVIHMPVVPVICSVAIRRSLLMLKTERNWWQSLPAHGLSGVVISDGLLKICNYCTLLMRISVQIQRSVSRKPWRYARSLKRSTIQKQ